MLQVLQDGLQWSSSGYSRNELGRKILIRVVLQVLHSQVWRSHTHLWDGLLQVPSPRLTHSCRDLLFGPAWKTRAASGLLLHLHEGSSRAASATNLKGTLLG